MEKQINNIRSRDFGKSHSWYGANLTSARTIKNNGNNNKIKIYTKDRL